MKCKILIGLLVFSVLTQNVHAGAKQSSSSSIRIVEEDINTEEEESIDSLLTDSSNKSYVEYEPLVSKGAGIAVRKDGLSNETVRLINTYFVLYRTLPNPLKESDTKKWRDEVSKAQFYYVQRGGVASIPQELKSLLNRANTLYQNTANERRPAAEPHQLNQEEKKDICANFPNGLKQLYEQICIK